MSGPPAPEPRVAPLPVGDARRAAEAAGIPAGLGELNVFRVLLTHPPLARALNDLLGPLLGRPTLDPRLRELVIMRVAWRTGSGYEWAQHWRLGPGFGAGADDLAAVRDWRASPRFGPTERAVLAAVDETLDGRALADDTWSALVAALGGDVRAAMECCFVIGGYQMLSGVLRTLRVPLDEGLVPWGPDGHPPPAAGGPPDLPYATLEEACEAFGRVNAGKVEAFRALGFPVVVGERDGTRFRDAYSGRWYWNCHCNGGVFNLGHRHPRVVAALASALEHLDIGNHHLISPWRARLADQLAATTGGRLGGVAFGVSGSEVVDLAVKLARGATGRAGIVSAVGGYHGVTGYAMAAGDPAYRDPFGPGAPGFTQVPWGDLEAMDAAIADDTAAVLLEAIPATLGFPLPPPGYLRAVGELCRARGAMLILDEVQTGLGRTGTVWSHTQDGAEPDMVVCGKGLSGGMYPITALLTTPEAHRVLDEHPFAHSGTFDGAELGCVAASAVLEVVTDPAFLARVRTLGERFEAGLTGGPFTLRRRGMTMGLAFDDPRGGMHAAAALIEAGVFAVWANNDPSVLQFKPPLVCTDDEADEIVRTVRSALG